MTRIGLLLRRAQGWWMRRRQARRYRALAERLRAA